MSLLENGDSALTAKSEDTNGNKKDDRRAEPQSSGHQAGNYQADSYRPQNDCDSSYDASAGDCPA
jgi:hypothetical protein